MVTRQQLLNQKRKNNIPAQLLNEAYPVQKDFILDASKRKAAFVLRRGGKTTAIAIYLLYSALSHPTTKSLYMGLSKESAENAMWLNIMEPILLKLNIPHKFNQTTKTLTLDNKSTIKLTGADATPGQINKYLGAKYLLAIFDECQDITHDLKHWIDGKLGPAMLDYGGTICLAGTAGRAIGRYWYDITQPQSELDSWNIHRWQAEDNLAMATKLRDEMARKTDEGEEKTEDYRNQYLCEWVLDNKERCYHNTEDNILTDPDTILSLMSMGSKWRYIIGFDFGFNDHTSFVVGAYSAHDKNFYIVETFKKAGMLTEETAEKLQELKDKYNPIYMVGDSQNLTVVETLRQQYHLPLRKAQKLGKEAHIAAMNSDFTMKKIKIIKQQNEELLKEWAALVWDEKLRVIGVFKEKGSRDNHSADACLYLHHFSKHFRHTPEPQPDANPIRTQVEAELKRSLNNQTYNYTDNTTIYDQIDNANFVIEKRNL